VSDRSWSPLTFSAPSGHRGCMVGLWLAPEAAATLAIPGGEAPAALHLTLLMLEDEAADLTDVRIAHLLACVDNLAAWQAPLAGEVSGIGRFYADDDSDAADGDDRQDVVYASVDAPGLSALREQLVREIGWEGLETSDAHGFDPHVTLAYVAPGAPWPIDTLPTIPLTFDALTVCVGDRQTVIPFRGFPAGDGIVYADGMYYADARKVGAGGRFFTELQTYMEPPSWLPLLPVPGEYKHASYGTVDLNADVIAQLVASINDGVYQASIPIDVSHNKADLDLNGALGWFGQARINADGSADVLVDKWTPRGEEAIRNEQFRYVSPEWDPNYVNNKGDEIENVVCGLALCTDPFFKELSIDRAIVASVRGATESSISIAYQFRDPVRFVAAQQGAVYAPEVLRMDTSVVDDGAGTTDATGVPTYEQWVAGCMPGEDTSRSAYAKELLASERTTAKASATDTAATDATAAAVTATSGRPDLSVQFADLSRRYEATEKALATEKAARRKKEFTDEVMGRSDANGIRWFGNIDNHVAILETLPDDKRALYIAEQRDNAKRMTAAAIKPEIGTDGADGAGDADAWSRIEAEAKTFMAADAGLSKEGAIARVLKTNTDLAQQYSREVRGK
jgi:2'-5' RNA ligase